jgi:hypothetical protein
MDGVSGGGFLLAWRLDVCTVFKYMGVILCESVIVVLMSVTLPLTECVAGSVSASVALD